MTASQEPSASGARRYDESNPQVHRVADDGIGAAVDHLLPGLDLYYPGSVAVLAEYPDDDGISDHNQDFGSDDGSQRCICPSKALVQPGQNESQEKDGVGQGDDALFAVGGVP